MDYVDVHDLCSISALVIGAPGKRVDTAPKASGCFLGGTQEIFGGVSEDLLGGTGKAEDAKLPGAGIGPKPCPGKCAAQERKLVQLSRVATDVELRAVIAREELRRQKYLDYQTRTF
jgi:hypothetical protein